MASDSLSPTMPITVVGYTTTPPKHNRNPTILITVTVVAIAVIVSFALYFLIRYFNRYFRLRSSSSTAPPSRFSSAHRVSPEITVSSATDSLPLFAFSSVHRSSSSSAVGGGDCAVCLSKFEQSDLLRLLPLCCHAFHADCIDAWLQSSLTCPLCRSTVFASESDVVKILRSLSSTASDSFRLEIGSISRRGTASLAAGETRPRTTSTRTYSVGEFDYLVDEDAEISFSRAPVTIDSGEKDDSVPVESPAANLAGEVAGEKNWKDYYDLISASISSTMSFRSSGRFFTGSSRRSDVVAVRDDEVEINQFGEEISEAFRWLSVV